MEGNLLIRGGKLFDPYNGYYGIEKEILIQGGKIAKIDDTIKLPENTRLLELHGEYVSPGFIDIHTHVYTGVSLGVPPDGVGINCGVTAVVDAGSSGAENFQDFLEKNIKTSKTRVYAALHYAKTGLFCTPEADEENKIDLDEAEKICRQYPEFIVAIKARASKSCVGKLGISSIAKGKQLARRVGVPLMIHIGNMPPTVEEVLDLAERGDIITHSFHGKKNSLFQEGKPKEQTLLARNRGVLFDVGHGKGSFSWITMKNAKKTGFDPDLISTDLHIESYDEPVYSLSETLSKMMALGYSLETCVKLVTGCPVRALKLKNIGELVLGNYGDFTIFQIQKGEFVFRDSDGSEFRGIQKMVIRYGIIGGEILMDLEKTEELRNRVMQKIWEELEGIREDYKDYEQDMRKVFQLLDKYALSLDENHMLAFINHIASLKQRQKNGETVMDMGEEVLEQIHPKAIKIANEVAALVLREKCSTAEIVLIAIHIQAAMGM